MLFSFFHDGIPARFLVLRSTSSMNRTLSSPGKISMSCLSNGTAVVSKPEWKSFPERLIFLPARLPQPEGSSFFMAIRKSLVPERYCLSLNHFIVEAIEGRERAFSHNHGRCVKICKIVPFGILLVKKKMGDTGFKPLTSTVCRLRKKGRKRRK